MEGSTRPPLPPGAAASVTGVGLLRLAPYNRSKTRSGRDGTQGEATGRPQQEMAVGIVPTAVRGRYGLLLTIYEK